MKKFSFVIPVYNSEKTIARVVDEILQTVRSMRERHACEIILVDDGSRDSVFEICRGLAARLPEVRPFRLSRNFGQASALMAGLSQVTGDFVICLDDDLQTPPAEFPALYDRLLTGDFDVVYGYYPDKKHSAFRNFGTRVNDLMQKILLDKPTALHTSSYFIARRYVVETVKSYNRPFPYLPGLFMQAAGRISSVPIRHASRQDGRSGYTFQKLLSLWLNGFTNFSIKPLRIASLLGFLISFFAFVMAVVLVILKLSGVDIEEGWTSITVLILFVGGIQLFCVGLLGEYVGRIYLSVNKTPQFVLRPEEIPRPADSGELPQTHEPR